MELLDKETKKCPLCKGNKFVTQPDSDMKVCYRCQKLRIVYKYNFQIWVLEKQALQIQKEAINRQIEQFNKAQIDIYSHIDQYNRFIKNQSNKGPKTEQVSPENLNIDDCYLKLNGETRKALPNEKGIKCDKCQEVILVDQDVVALKCGHMFHISCFGDGIIEQETECQAICRKPIYICEPPSNI